jgi:phospholipid transport system substrate-binding protein
VDTRVVGGRSAALKVGYRLHLVGNEWKVYDMVIDEVSMVTNYGAQFRRILRTSSLEQLLSKLREKGSDHPS